MIPRPAYEMSVYLERSSLLYFGPHQRAWLESCFLTVYEVLAVTRRLLFSFCKPGVSSHLVTDSKREVLNDLNLSLLYNEPTAQ